MEIKYKYNPGDQLFLATAKRVDEVRIKETSGAKEYDEPLYVVEVLGDFPSLIVVEERDIKETKLEALHTALDINDYEAMQCREQVKSCAATLDLLADKSRRLRQLLYEEQILEYMRQRNESHS